MPTISANIIQDAFGPLIKVFETILVFIHAHITGGSWGLAIIGLTIVVRAALVPLTLKQFSSMAKLQALGPELKELQKKHKDDKPRLNEEMMKFYKENEVNPFGSCLPLVLQLPVFLSLFYMLRLDLKPHICGAALKAHHIVSEAAIAKQSCGAIDPNSGKFLFIPDVTTSASGGVLVILIVLYIGSQLVASLLTTATVDRNQRLLMLGLPFVFSIFIAGFPAGLLVYWITTNIWTVGQQYIVRRRSAPMLALAAAANAGGGGAGGDGRKAQVDAPSDKPASQGLMARLTATRDAARSAVTGVRPSDGATKNGRAAAKGTNGRPTPAKAKPVTPTPRGGSPKSRGPGVAAAGPSRASKASAAKAPPAKAPGAGAASQPKASKSPGGKARATPADATTPGAKPAPARARPPRGAAKAPAGAEGDAAPPKAEPPQPRARGAVPPPPPRKKKKRSGRRR